MSSGLGSDRQFSILLHSGLCVRGPDVNSVSSNIAVDNIKEWMFLPMPEHLLMALLQKRVAKTILQSTVKGGRRQGGQRKRWEDNIKEWTGLGFSKSQRAVENREKWRKLVCEIICGAPMTLAVEGLMMTC